MVAAGGVGTVRFADGNMERSRVPRSSYPLFSVGESRKDLKQKALAITAKTGGARSSHSAQTERSGGLCEDVAVAGSKRE